MLSVEEIVMMLAAGKKLPQQQERDVPTDEVGKVQEEARAILVEFIAAHKVSEKAFEEVLMGLPERVRKVGREHGRYTTTALMSMEWSMLTGDVDLSALPGMNGPVPEDEETLCKVFQFAASHATEEGVWSVPLGMMHSADEETAYNAAIRLMTAACAGIYLKAQKENEDG